MRPHLRSRKPKDRDEVKRFEVYYESIKREPKIRGIKKCRCDERLQIEFQQTFKQKGAPRGKKKNAVLLY
jgi:hypothetical protein